MRIEDHEEAPPLFPEPVLAWFFLQEWHGGTREKHDTGGNREQMITGSCGTSNEDTDSRW